MFQEFVDLHYPLLNHLVRERVDPLLGAACDALGRCYLLLELLVMFLGFVLLTRRSCSSDRRNLETVAFSVLVVSLILLSAPFDPFVLNLHWFPWLLLACEYRAVKRSPVAVVWIAVAGAIWLYTAGAAAFLGTTIAFVYLQSRMREEQRRDVGRADLALLGALCALSIWFMPVYPMPAYPWGARLADISSFAFSPEPYFAPSLIPDPIKYDQYLVLVKAYGVRLALCLALLSLAAPTPKAMGRGFVGAALFALLVVPSDLLLYPYFGEASPYRFLRRLVPGVAIFAIPWKISPLMLLVSGSALRRRTSMRRLLILSAIAVTAVAADASFKLLPGPRALSGEPAAKEASHSSPSNLASSPSAFVYDVYRDFVSTHRPNDTALVQLRPGHDYAVQAQATLNSEHAAAAVDGSMDTRWATGRPQSSGDAVTLTLDRPVNLSAVRLVLGKNGSDFPRGIALELRSAEDQPFRRVVSIPHWYGPLQFAASGYPYFGPQSEVLLWLPAAERCTSLRFIQVSSDPFYDWSIAEVELFGPKQ